MVLMKRGNIDHEDGRMYLKTQDLGQDNTVWPDPYYI